MARQEQTQEVQKKVVAAALRLLLQKGYAQTTLREISVAAGVSYGSIYHHFGDKEGIFRELILEHFERTQQLADRGLPDTAGPYERLGLKWAGLVQAISQSRPIAEMLSVAYHSWKLSEPLMRISTTRHHDWLRAELPDWSETQFYAATLMLKGALSNLVDERLNNDRLTSEERIRALLSSALPAFGATPEITKHVIGQALMLAAPITADGLADGIKPALNSSSASKPTD